MERPMYGQQIREVIENHHDLFSNFIKKPTIYYQLERLAQEGYLEIRREPVEAPGPGAAHADLALRERDIYYITEHGRSYFATLLRETLSAYTPTLSDIDACLFFLQHMPSHDAIRLLMERYQTIAAYRNAIVVQIEAHKATDDAHQLVNDHKLTLLDAELRWLERTIEHLRVSRNVSSIEHT